MNHQYLMINDCLRLLKDMKMSAVDKLHLESRLIQMKILLLRDQNGLDVVHEDWSEHLLNAMQKLRDEKCQKEVVQVLLEEIEDVLRGLHGG